MTAIDPGRPATPATPAVPVPTETARQLTTVRVNLLPEEVTRARHGHKVRRVAFASLAVLVLLLGGVSFYARAGVGSAQADLAAADGLSAGLRAQQSRYAQVVTLQEQVRTAAERLAQVTAGDLGWAPLLSAVLGAAPAGVTVLGIDATQDSGPAGSVGGAAGGTGAGAGAGGAGATAAGGAAGTTTGTPATPAGTTGVATLTLTGEATEPVRVAAFVDALAKVHGLQNVIATGVATTGTPGGYSYGISAVITSAAALATTPTAGGK